MELKIKKLYQDTKIPERANKYDAGFDCFIHSFDSIDVKHSKYQLKPLERILCGLGFSTSIKKGYYAKIVPRSGLALDKGLSIVNTPATIDLGYRGEWKVILINLSDDEITLNREMKICQFIIEKIPKTSLKIVKNLNQSDRGKGGFGSTGES